MYSFGSVGLFQSFLSVLFSHTMLPLPVSTEGLYLTVLHGVSPILLPQDVVLFGELPDTCVSPTADSISLQNHPLPYAMLLAYVLGVQIWLFVVPSSLQCFLLIALLVCLKAMAYPSMLQVCIHWGMECMVLEMFVDLLVKPNQHFGKSLLLNKKC